MDELSERLATAARQEAESKERVALAPRTSGLAGSALEKPSTPGYVVAPRRVKVRRERLHSMVKVEPAEVDAGVYRDALPIFAKWRRCLVARKAAPNIRACLQGKVRLLEFRMIDGHQLTLPPATDPWDGTRRYKEMRLSLQVLDWMRRQLVGRGRCTGRRGS